jgi:hypothetical protein
MLLKNDIVRMMSLIYDGRPVVLLMNLIKCQQIYFLIGFGVLFDSLSKVTKRPYSRRDRSRSVILSKYSSNALERSVDRTSTSIACGFFKANRMDREDGKFLVTMRINPSHNFSLFQTCFPINFTRSWLTKPERPLNTLRD